MTINGKIVTSDIIEAYREAKALKQQLKTVDEMLQIYTGTIKEFMLTNAIEICYDTTGAEIVTWKQSKDKTDLDKSMVRELFPKVWNKCQIIVPGTKMFLLK